MWTSDQIVLYFRSLINDADASFITDPELAVALSAAYNKFRRLVNKYDKSFYAIRYSQAAPAATSLDLNNLMLGATPTQPRLQSIVNIFTTDGATPPVIQRKMRAALSFEQLRSGSGFGDLGYWLDNRIVYFNTSIMQPIMIEYTPGSSFSWAANLTAATFVDDLMDEFGDLLALLAIKTYTVKSNSDNGQYEGELQSRLADLKRYLCDSRSGDAGDSIVETDW